MKAYILVLLIMGLSLEVFAQAENASRRRSFNTENFLALRGFDPVSYFKGKPVKGNEKIWFDFKGIVYYFSSEENKKTFSESPQKYEPAYGGWCAYTMATSGERVKVDPTTYKIIDQKLYLFYNFNTDNRLLKWNNGGQAKLIAAGNSKWKLR